MQTAPHRLLCSAQLCQALVCLNVSVSVVYSHPPSRLLQIYHCSHPKIKLQYCRNIFCRSIKKTDIELDYFKRLKCNNEAERKFGCCRLQPAIANVSTSSWCLDLCCWILASHWLINTNTWLWLANDTSQRHPAAKMTLLSPTGLKMQLVFLW